MCIVNVKILLQFTCVNEYVTCSFHEMEPWKLTSTRIDHEDLDIISQEFFQCCNELFSFEVDWNVRGGPGRRT